MMYLIHKSCSLPSNYQNHKKTLIALILLTNVGYITHQAR